MTRTLDIPERIDRELREMAYTGSPWGETVQAVVVRVLGMSLVKDWGETDEDGQAWKGNGE